jgi:hypothetical protein
MMYAPVCMSVSCACTNQHIGRSRSIRKIGLRYAPASAGAPYLTHPFPLRVPDVTGTAYAA